MSFFSKMAVLNKAALLFLALGKLSGMIGVSLGFLQNFHELGGYILGFAFFFISCSVVCVLLQTAKDRKAFELEDEEKERIKSFTNIKKNLQEEIRLLEDKRNALQNLQVQRGKLL